MDSSTESETTEKQPYYCRFEECKATFKKKRKLINHSRLHCGERPFACNIDGCTKSYTNSSHLARHKSTFHNKLKVKLLCTFEGCELMLSDAYSLKRHISLKHNINRVYRYMCTECNKGFVKKSQLQTHSFEHTGELPHKCQTCGQRFPNIHRLGRHQRTHTVYTCNCGKQFERWSVLLAHRKTCEAMKKEFRCEVCDKKCPSNRALKLHTATHKPDDEKEIFMCPRDNCDRSYIHRSNLHAHIQRFHENIKKRIPCPIENCGATLSRMRNLNTHLRVHREGIKRKAMRKPRKDKGIPRVSMARKLTRVSEALELNHSICEITDTVEENISTVVKDMSTVMEDVSRVGKNMSTVVEDMSSDVEDMSTVVEDMSTDVEDMSTDVEDMSRVGEDISTVEEDKSTDENVECDKEHDNPESDKVISNSSIINPILKQKQWKSGQTIKHIKSMMTKMKNKDQNILNLNDDMNISDQTDSQNKQIEKQQDYKLLSECYSTVSMSDVDLDTSIQLKYNSTPIVVSDIKVLKKKVKVKKLCEQNNSDIEVN